MKKNFWKILIVLNSLMVLGLYVFAFLAVIQRKELESNQDPEFIKKQLQNVEKAGNYWQRNPWATLIGGAVQGNKIL